MGDDNKYKTVLEEFENESDVRLRWQAVEAQTNSGFFLSWAWIGTLINAYEWEPRCLTVYCDENPVAIGLLGKQRLNRHFFVRGVGVFLNETGVTDQDQVWIEYNDFLVADAHPDAKRLCYKYLLGSMRDWDECCLSGLTESSVGLIRAATDLHTLVDWKVPAYQVDLERIRARDVDYLNCLSRNTRYQIRRAIRAYEQQGELKLTSAGSVSEALEMFDSAGEYHRRRWGEGVGQSGYANPKFTKFHRSLIRTCWPKGEVELLRLEADSNPLAYFYNFVKRGRVYFYLSGVKQEAESILKPGLVGHALAIQMYLNRGMLCYDFMGGDARYKRSLGEPGQELTRLRLQRRRLYFGLESSLKRMKQAFQG